MLVRWFGKSWGASICTAASHSATPTGVACAYCSRSIDAESQGLIVLHVEAERTNPRPWHLDCWMQALGLNEKAN